MMRDVEVLYEDNHLIVVNKPPLLATANVAAGVDSMAERVRQYLRDRYRKPGNVFLGIVSRLDSHSSGVLVFARTSKGASRLARQFREGTVEKRYLAIIEGSPPRDEPVLVDWMVKDDARRRMVVTGREARGARRAELSWRQLGVRDQTQTLVEIRLVTGRKHQIRLQFSARGAPIVGDRKYGSTLSFGGIALHAKSLEIAHPVRSERLTFAAEPPKNWKIHRFGDI